MKNYKAINIRKNSLIFFLILIFICQTAVGQVSVTYTYDNINRITEARYSNGTTINYLYDGVGNRTSMVVQVCSNVRETLKTGNWNDVTVWSCNLLPVSTNIVQINLVHTVSLPVNYIGNLQSIILKGQLIYGVGSKLKFGN